MQSTHIVNEGTYGVLEVFGPTLELSILPEEAEGAYCTMTGTIPQVFRCLFIAILILKAFSGVGSRPGNVSARWEVRMAGCESWRACSRP
jgi:hypothetical protein